MIRFEGVTKSYGSTWALRGVDIEARDGELLILIGPSGCGKTTALKMINRLITPTEGRVFIKDEDVAGMDAVQLRREIGYVIQETGLFPHMTIASNIALVPKLKKWSRSRREERVDELLHLVGLDPAIYRDRFPRHLSGGQRQRVGVARALAADPPVILMDEPFGATDPITRKQLQRELVRIKEQVRKTIVFVTHDISEAFLLGDGVCILKDGKVVQQGSPEDLIRAPADNFVVEFIGDEGWLRQLDYLQMSEVADEEVTVIPAHTPVTSLADRMVNGELADALVVNETGRFEGVISRDVVHQIATNGKHLVAKDVATFDGMIVNHEERVRDCFPRMVDNVADGGEASERNGSVPAAPIVVVDERERPVGVVTYEQLVRLIADMSGGAA